jgi:hypothetical protein
VPLAFEEGPCLRMADGFAVGNHDGAPYQATAQQGPGEN